MESASELQSHPILRSSDDGQRRMSSDVPRGVSDLHILYFASSRLVVAAEQPEANALINKIMAVSREFDIITGKPAMGERSSSFSNHPSAKRYAVGPRRLDHSRDHADFKYSYDTPLLRQNCSAHLNPGKKSSEGSMLNCVSTNYNIINHCGQHQTSKVVDHNTYQLKLPEVNKKSPLTIHLKSSMIFSPNYRPNYQERVLQQEFVRFRNQSFLGDISDNQKRSGGRFFRKYK